MLNVKLLGALWSASIESAPDMIQQARRDLEDHPLDLVTHHRLARSLAEAGQFDKAIAAFMTALALPVGQSEKLDVGTDFAIFATYLRARSQDDLLDSARIRFALKACPKVTAHAESMLMTLEAQGALAAIGQAAVADVLLYLRDFVWRQGACADLRPTRRERTHAGGPQAVPSATSWPRCRSGALHAQRAA